MLNWGWRLACYSVMLLVKFAPWLPTRGGRAGIKENGVRGRPTKVSAARPWPSGTALCIKCPQRRASGRHRGGSVRSRGQRYRAVHRVRMDSARGAPSSVRVRSCDASGAALRTGYKWTAHAGRRRTSAFGAATRRWEGAARSFSAHNLPSHGVVRCLALHPAGAGPSQRATLPRCLARRWWW